MNPVEEGFFLLGVGLAAGAKVDGACAEALHVAEEVVAALFVAQISGINLDFGEKIQLAVTSALAAAGIAGVPEAGLITLSLVLASVRLPIAALPILLTVDWLLGRFRAATNVTSDLLVATLLDRLGGPSPEDDDGALTGPVINSESGPA